MARKGVKEIPLRLKPELHEWLRTAAYESRVSMNAIVVSALEMLRGAEKKS